MAVFSNRTNKTLFNTALVVIGIGLVLIAIISLNKDKAPLNAEQRISEHAQKESELFQKDADIVRLRHLKYWVAIIEDYQSKVGHYPLQGESDTPLYVFIATPSQLASLSTSDHLIASGQLKSPFSTSTSSAPPTRTMKDFVNVLEAGLNRQITEYYDPQDTINTDNSRPNLYTYTINNDTYTFSINTHQHYLFSRFIAPNFHTVEVSNVGNPSANLILTPQMLFNSSHYKIAAGKAISNPNLFEKGHTRHMSE